MASSLRLGIIGLGWRWRRYQPAIAAMGKAVRIQAVFDAFANRAAEEAGRSKCLVAGGVVELIDRDDIDAILLTSGGWMGLWPLWRAAVADKPIYCAVSPVADEERVDALRATAERPRIYLAHWPTSDLLILAFEDRVLEAIGPPRVVQATWAGNLRTSEEPLRSSAALALLDACSRLMGAKPQAITATAVSARPHVVSINVEYGNGRIANLFLVESSIPRCRLDILAEQGTASLSLPGRLDWRNTEGRFAYRLPRDVAELASLEGFLAAIEEEEPFADFAKLFCSLDWLRAARVSRAEGRRVRLDVES